VKQEKNLMNIWRLKMTKKDMNQLRINLAHAVMHRRKVEIDGQRIMGVLIGFVPEKTDKRQFPIWSLDQRTIRVSDKKIIIL
jgi:hypothetical protein